MYLYIYDFFNCCICFIFLLLWDSPQLDNILLFFLRALLKSPTGALEAGQRLFWNEAVSSRPLTLLLSSSGIYTCVRSDRWRKVGQCFLIYCIPKFQAQESACVALALFPWGVIKFSPRWQQMLTQKPEVSLINSRSVSGMHAKWQFKCSPGVR